jgi:hypothetical protein
VVYPPVHVRDYSQHPYIIRALCQAEAEEPCKKKRILEQEILSAIQSAEANINIPSAQARQVCTNSGSRDTIARSGLVEYPSIMAA